MQLRAGIYPSRHPEQTDGWRILCEQEKTPHFLTTERPDCPVLLCEGETPVWLPDYLQEGGIAVLSGMHPEELPFPTDYIGTAALEFADLTELDCGTPRIASLVPVYAGSGLGLLRLHESRKIKCGLHPDEYPAIVWQSVGKGGCWYTGIPFSELICALGDTLRRTTPDSDFTERITSVDKHLLLRAMRELLIRSYGKRGLPYVYLHYYPGNYQSVFVFRVDIDGIYGDHLRRISDAAKKAGIRVTFYTNKSLCEPEAERLRDIDPSHDIGCHADVHNLFTTQEENFRNVHDCRAWMKDLGIDYTTGFVAPRGMWNFALNRALEKDGITYTSDFGYAVFGLPFYPYDHGTRMAVKQLPVDPFSTERAVAKAEEEGTALPEGSVTDYFCRSVRRQAEAGLPVILYSHPQHFGLLAEETFPRLAEAVRALPLWHATMGELDAWWQKRDGADYAAFWEDSLTVTGDLPEDVSIRVIEPKGE